MPESLNWNPKILGLSMPLSEPNGFEHEEACLIRLKNLYDQLGTDPDKNIKTLVAKAAGLVGACCSAYYHVVGSHNALRLHASGSLPRNFSRALQSGPCSLWPQPGWFGQPVPFVIEDLHLSTHAKMHAGLLRCGLRSCLVNPVFCDGSL
jgi:hypothetical protein